MSEKVVYVQGSNESTDKNEKNGAEGLKSIDLL